MRTPGTEPSRSSRSERGFTLIELLVALGVMGLIGLAFVSFFTASSRARAIADTRIETHQAVVATMDAMARDLRLAGGICFPSNGEFISLAGANNGAQDRVTIRFANTVNQLCVPPTTLVGAATSGSNTLRVSSAAGFAVDSMGYLTDGGTGQFFRVVSVSISGPNSTLTTDTSWTRTYQPNSSSVYTVQEHAYRVDPTGDARGSVLRLQRDRGTDDVFADGITALNVRYRKVDNSIVDLPADDAEWRLVKEVLLSVTARSLSTLPGGGVHQETANLTIKPRNLQP